MKLPLLLFLCTVLNAFSSEVFEGPGPGHACEGTSLKVETENKNVVSLEYTLRWAFHTVVETFRPTSNGGWNVTVRVYSKAESGRSPDLLSTDRFKAANTKKIAEITHSLGLGDIDWASRPQKLISYFQENPQAFVKKD